MLNNARIFSHINLCLLAELRINIMQHVLIVQIIHPEAAFVIQKGEPACQITSNFLSMPILKGKSKL